MCGIVGGITSKNITPLLMDGLKRLEYRGYDSSGLVILSQDNKLLRERAAGKVSNLENQEYTTYCPIVKINKKNVVLFLGYIFIYLDKHNENWSPIRSTKSVKNFLLDLV